MVSLSPLFSDNMILQRYQAIKIWGEATIGHTILVELRDENKEILAYASTITLEKGDWSITLPAQSAGDPYSLQIQSGEEKLSVRNIMIGELWVASGQSNMWWTMAMLPADSLVIQHADYPDIRFLTVPEQQSLTTIESVASTKWQVCTPENVLSFSATAYYFARKIHEELDIPVGIISSAIGGTLIESWIPKEGLKMVWELTPAYNKWDAATELPTHRPKDFPSANYNAMIHPYIRFPVKGFIWYHGEENIFFDDSPELYANKMKALILSWRQAWRNETLPFYMVQLTPYRYTSHVAQGQRRIKTTDILPRFWIAQQRATELSHTGIVCTTDLGEIDNLHPIDKKSVGERLSRWALAKDYEQQITFSGPQLDSTKLKKNKVKLFFKYAKNGLRTKDNKAVDSFQISGEDGVFRTAIATILPTSNCIEVYHSQIAQPKQIRFGWWEEAQPNLVNMDGLPAFPFTVKL